MKRATFLIVPALLAFSSVEILAQNLNLWGSAFDCGVDWFSQCSVVQENRPAEPTRLHAASANPSSVSEKSRYANLPPPVRNVLENPSPETATEYVLWSRERNEKLAKASEYITQAMRELNSEVNSAQRTSNLSLAGVGPVGLYYFFSPDDESAVKDVAVLNKIWREGRLGVVGIPVSGKDEEIVSFVNEAKALFPIRRGDAEGKLVKPAGTPALYLALLLEKKMFRLGTTITETSIAEAIGSIVAARTVTVP